MDKDKFIPSMFHRRLLLLLVGCGIVFVILTGQMVRLSVVEGSERLAEAEAKLDRLTFLPTHRGRILDRHNRVLAMDRASSDVAVNYSVITGLWVQQQARREAIKQTGRSRWNSLSRAQREAAMEEQTPELQARCDRLWKEICDRGEITPDELQRRLNAIKASVQSTAAAHWERQWIKEQTEYGITAEEFKPQAIREQREAHVVLPRVSDDLAFAFRKVDQEMPGMLEVQDSRRREYPWANAEVLVGRAGLPRQISSNKPQTIRVAGVADHILGSMRDEIWEADVKRRPFRNPDTGGIDLGWYRPGDSVGSRGIERVFEDHLRGLRGEIRERIDTGEQVKVEAQPGHDLQLTLDIALQSRVQAILSPEFGLTKVQPWQKNNDLPLGMPLNSAAVVIEVETGEILAMVSMPTIAMGAAMSDLQQLVQQPMVNRAVEAVYPPGSILKPMVLVAGVTEQLHNLDAPITCTGHYFPDNKGQARCWIYRDKYGLTTHGPLHADEALARSCNIYFYTLGDRLGMNRLIKWFGFFGLGRALDIGLLMTETDSQGKVSRFGESDGALPSDERIQSLRARRELKFSEVIMGIGQGPITWTPVQAANAYAMLARGGSVRDATLLLDDPRGTRAPRCDDLRLSAQLVRTTLEGLRQSVMERYGTGHHISYDDDHTDEPIINAEAVLVWAKTGTAQAPPARLFDTNRDGEINSKDVAQKLDHSWFVGLVGPKQSNKPMYAITVIVEYGGSGGRTAGPIANQIMRALQAEGYLPGDANAGGSMLRQSPALPEPEPDHEEPEFAGEHDH